VSVARSAGPPTSSFGSFAAWPAAAGIAVVAAGFVVAGLRRCGPQRAIMTGAAAGLIFGVVVFGDVIHVSAGMLLLQGAGLAALIPGVILVARAPVLSRPGRPASLLRPHTQAAAPASRPVPPGPRAGPLSPGPRGPLGVPGATRGC
jgi:hypothetical protein